MPRAFRRRVYDTLRMMSTAGNRPRDMGIMQLHPTTDWARVWSNLRTCHMFVGRHKDHLVYGHSRHTTYQRAVTHNFPNGLPPL
jgi:hypothetical protein